MPRRRGTSTGSTARPDSTLFTTVGGDGCVIRDVVEYGGSVYVLTLMDGLYECDGDGRVTQYFRLPVEYEKSAGAKELFLDTSGIIWVATQSGLLLLDPATGSTHLLRSNLHYPYSLPNNSVWSIFPDPDGGVWVGTYRGKLAYMTLADNGVNYFKATPGGLNHPIVSCFEEDDAGNLWIGTEGRRPEPLGPEKRPLRLLYAGEPQRHYVEHD
ncbi:MAG: two-component regulator propeller domain-containing protein [Alistipes finegoldii]